MKTKTITTAIAFVVGLTMVIEYFFNIPLLGTLATRFRAWAVTIAAFALGIGCINLFRIHIGNVNRRSRGYERSLITLAAMVVTLVIGLSQGADSTGYRWIFERMYTPLMLAGSGLLLFFIITASLRAFTLKSRDAWVLLVSTMLVMLGNVAFGQFVYSGMPGVKDWLLTVPNMAAQRAVIFGGSLGILATALRTILGIEIGDTGGVGGGGGA